MDAFGERDDAAPEPVMDRLDLGQKFAFVEDALRQIDQMRSIALDRPCGATMRRSEPGVAAHHDRDETPGSERLLRSAPMNA